MGYNHRKLDADNLDSPGRTTVSSSSTPYSSGITSFTLFTVKVESMARSSMVHSSKKSVDATYNCGGKPLGSPPSWGLSHKRNGSNGRSGALDSSDSLPLSSLVLPSHPPRTGNLNDSPRPARAMSFCIPFIRLRCPKLLCCSASSARCVYPRRLILGL